MRGRLKREGRLFGASPSPNPSCGGHRAALSPQAGRGRNNEDRTRAHIPISHSPSRSPFHTAFLVPAARFLRPGFETFASLPQSRGGGAPRVVGCLRGTRGPARDAAGQALARRLASHNAGRPPLGALTVAVLGSGAALASPDLRPDRLRAPRVRVVVPGWRLSVPPGAAGASRYRRTPRLAPSSGSSLEHAL